MQLRMEIGNMSKEQQPDQKADYGQKPAMGFQRSEKIHFTAGSSISTRSVKRDVILNYKTYN